MYWSNSRRTPLTSAMNVVSSSSRVQSTGPAQDGDRVAVARPRLAIDPAPDRPRPRMPAPVEVVGEAAEAFELRREAERGRRNRGDLWRGVHVRAMIAFAAGLLNRFSAPAAAYRRPGPSLPWPDADAHRVHRRRVRAVGEDRRPRRRRRRPRPVPGQGPRGDRRPRRRLPAALPVRAGSGGRRPRQRRCACRTRTPSAERSSVTIIDVEADGYRLRLVDHPAAFDRDGLYGLAERRRLRRQRLAVRAALPGRARDAAGREPTDRSTSSISTTGTPARPRSSATAGIADDPVLGRAAVVLTLHNLAYHGWTPLESLGQLGPGAGRRHRRRPTPSASTSSRPASSGPRWSNTVSPGYARESLTPELGFGLDGDAAGEGRPLPRDPQRPRHRGLEPGDRRRPRRALLGRRPGRQGGLPGRPARPASASTRPTTGRSSG